MRVAVVGLGSIARKAYLPVVTSFRGITPVLVSRTRSSLAAVGDAYRIPDRFDSLTEAIDGGLDAALVHTTSESHPEVVATLLRAGVPVLVDKPLALELESARELVALARGVSLMVGFNRRYAPAYRAFADWADRDVVSLQKHRSHAPGPVRQMVLDDFIHVIDTLRFLVPSPLDNLVTTAHVDDLGRCPVLDRRTVQLGGGLPRPVAHRRRPGAVVRAAGQPGRRGCAEPARLARAVAPRAGPCGTRTPPLGVASATTASPGSSPRSCSSSPSSA